MIVRQGADAGGELLAHVGGNGVADAALVEAEHQLVLVEGAVAAQQDLVDPGRQGGKGAIDDAQIAGSGRHVAVAELVGEDDVLLGPEREDRLVAAQPVIGPLGRALVAVDDGGVDVERCRPYRPARLEVEHEFAICRRQAGERRALGRNARAAAALHQRQVLVMELREKVARRLRRRQSVTEHRRKRAVLAELVEILGALAARRPQRQKALDHRRGG